MLGQRRRLVRACAASRPDDDVAVEQHRTKSAGGVVERPDPVGPPTERDPPANDQHGGGNAGCDGLELSR